MAMSGNLLEDISPPIIPPKEIDDAEDSKPEDWDERERIPDPDATKPDDWDETAPAKITDTRFELSQLLGACLNQRWPWARSSAGGPQDPDRRPRYFAVAG